MESDYDYWWYKSLKTIKSHKNTKLLHVYIAYDSLLKCTKN